MKGQGIDGNGGCAYGSLLMSLVCGLWVAMMW